MSYPRRDSTNIVGRSCMKCEASTIQCLSKISPCVYNLFFSRKGQHMYLKRIFGFLYGLLLGIGFYELILIDLNFAEYAGLAVGLFISLLLAIGIAFSSQIRCIALLCMPAFSGKAGRSVLKAVVLAFIISGPIANLSTNGKEVVRTFACTTSLTYNLTKTRFELMFKPFTSALFGMKADVHEIKDTIRSIRDVSAPITGEMEDEAEMKKMKEENDYIDNIQGDTKQSNELDEKYKTKGEQIEAQKFEKKYMEKVELRCQEQFSKAATKCRSMFSRGYDVCYDTVTWVAAWLLCWPMKLNFVCNIGEALGGKSRCDPAKDMDPGFGEGYSYLKNSRGTLTQNFKDVRLQYKIDKMKYLTDVRDATDTAKSILHNVNAKKTILDAILKIMKRVLAFIFLRLIIDAQKYHDTYLRDIEFDNIYVTQYFRKVDARRHAKESHTLLPLKKIERLKLVNPWDFKPLKTEKEQIFSETFKLGLEMLTATTFILLDRLFYEALDLVRRHAKVDFYQSGHHDMMLQVKGTGMIAGLLRSIVKGFNIKKRIKTVRSNAACLPQPSELPHYYLFKIYGVYLAVWVLIIVQAYVQRLRRVICAYFYTRREKKRVLYLYNETLKRRIGFMRHMKKKVKKMVREQRLEADLNLFTVLRLRFPKYCGCLTWFAAARRKCVICGDPEPRKKSGIPGDFEKCSNPTCYFVHCLECWNDVGRYCFACEEGGTDDSEIGSDSDLDHHD